MTTFQPADAKGVEEAVAWALAHEAPLEIVGAGTKRTFGRPFQSQHTLDLSRLAGIRMYEPEELVMQAGAGTRLIDIENELRAKRQMLAFEPADLGPLLGGEAGRATIGGVFACNLSGPRRVKVGAARDHLLGAKAVSGRGESFKTGGRVVKNVTGYDLCKLLTGSYGTLAAMTEVTFKVLPAPEATRTVAVMGLGDARAVEAMAKALGSPHEVASAAHVPAESGRASPVAAAGQAMTAIKLEGPEASARHRAEAICGLLKGYGPADILGEDDGARLWRWIRDVQPFVGRATPVWRLSVPPAEGAAVVARLRRTAPCEALYDWGGGLVWLCLDSDDVAAELVRAAIEPAGGHATLIRASVERRAAVPVFQPQPPALAALTRRVKDSFDPKGILNPGRMYAGV